MAESSPVQLRSRGLDFAAKKHPDDSIPWSEEAETEQEEQEQDDYALNDNIVVSPSSNRFDNSASSDQISSTLKIALTFMIAILIAVTVGFWSGNLRIQDINDCVGGGKKHDINGVKNGNSSSDSDAANQANVDAMNEANQMNLFTTQNVLLAIIIELIASSLTSLVLWCFCCEEEESDITAQETIQEQNSTIVKQQAQILNLKDKLADKNWGYARHAMSRLSHSSAVGSATEGLKAGAQEKTRQSERTDGGNNSNVVLKKNSDASQTVDLKPAMSFEKFKETLHASDCSEIEIKHEPDFLGTVDVEYEELLLLKMIQTAYSILINNQDGAQ